MSRPKWEYQDFLQSSKGEKNSRVEKSRKKTPLLVFLIFWSLESIQKAILVEKNKSNWIWIRSFAGTATRKTTMQTTT